MLRSINFLSITKNRNIPAEPGQYLVADCLPCKPSSEIVIKSFSPFGKAGLICITQHIVRHINIVSESVREAEAQARNSILPCCMMYATIFLEVLP